MLTINNFYDITKYNYSINELKVFAKNYKLKIGGNKSELIMRIFNHLYLSSKIVKIQSLFRGFILRKFNKLIRLNLIFFFINQLRNF